MVSATTSNGREIAGGSALNGTSSETNGRGQVVSLPNDYAPRRRGCAGPFAGRMSGRSPERNATSRSTDGHPITPTNRPTFDYLLTGPGSGYGTASQDSELIPLGRTLREPGAPAFPVQFPLPPSPQGVPQAEPRRGKFAMAVVADPIGPQAQRDQTMFARLLDSGRRWIAGRRQPVPHAGWPKGTDPVARTGPRPVIPRA